MKIDQSRLERQRQGLKLWKNQDYKGTLRWATGVGKTFAGILAIKHIRKRNPDAFVIVSVPTDNLRTQWRNRLAEHNLNRVYVDTVHSLVGKNHECDFFIMDEIHSYTGGEVFSTLFDCVNRSYTLGLTARERDKPEDQAILNKNAPVIDIITLEEALKNGWVSAFQVYNYGLELTSNDRLEYDKINKQYNKYFSTFDFDFELAMKCLKSDNARQATAHNMMMDKDTVDIHTFQFNRVMQKRKKFLYNSEAIKLIAVKAMKKFSDKKIITFSETQSMADELTKAMGCEARSYHTNLPTIKIDGKKYAAKRQKDLYLEWFKNNKIRIINSVRSLNEGTDIPDVDMSIKTAFNSTIRDSIQRLGRTLRKNGDKQAVELNLYIVNSQSEKWLRKSQKETPNVKWINSLDQIKH